MALGNAGNVVMLDDDAGCEITADDVTAGAGCTAAGGAAAGAG